MKEKKIKKKEKKQVIKTNRIGNETPTFENHQENEGNISNFVKRQRLEKLCFKTYGDDLL